MLRPSYLEYLLGAPDDHVQQTPRKSPPETDDYSKKQRRCKHATTVTA